MTLVAALGDSFTCGEGVGVRVDPDATWVALLARALPGGRLVRLAEPGARVADVALGQVPLLPARVQLATLVVGLNDVARSGFDADVVGAALLDVVAVLRRRAEEVLVGRLHDPAARLPLPSRVGQAARRRIALVNAAVDEAGSRPGVRVLDLDRVPALAQPGGWAVDRIHPSAAGHRGMAVAAAEVLRSGGRVRPAPVRPGSVPVGPSGPARTWWAVRHGLPYAAGHLPAIGGPVASALVRRG